MIRLSHFAHYSEDCAPLVWLAFEKALLELRLDCKTRVAGIRQTALSTYAAETQLRRSRKVGGSYVRPAASRLSSRRVDHNKIGPSDAAARRAMTFRPGAFAAEQDFLSSQLATAHRTVHVSRLQHAIIHAISGVWGDLDHMVRSRANIRESALTCAIVSLVQSANHDQGRRPRQVDRSARHRSACRR